MSDKTSIFYDLNQFVKRKEIIAQYMDQGLALDGSKNTPRSSWYGELIHQPLVDCFHEEGLEAAYYRHDSDKTYFGKNRMLAIRKLFWPPKWVDLLLRVIPRLLVGGLAALLQVHEKSGRFIGLRRAIFFFIGVIIWMPFRLLNIILSPIVSPINVVVKLILQGIRKPNSRFGVIFLASVLLAGAAAAIIFTGGLGAVLPAAVGGFLSALALPLWANIVAVAGTFMMSVGLLNKLTSFEYKAVIKEFEDVELMPIGNLDVRQGFYLRADNSTTKVATIAQEYELGYVPNDETQDAAFDYDDGPSIRSIVGGKSYLG